MGSCSKKLDLAAALGVQRGMHLSKHRAELLVPHEGTEGDHITKALSCDSPYTKHTALAADLSLGIWLLDTYEGELSQWREKQFLGLSNLAEDCKHLDKTQILPHV